MDILKWLDEAEQPRVPRNTSRREHSQRRPKSDSSLLEPLCLQTHSTQQGVRDQSVGEVLVASPSDCSTSSRYVRKPRRKTRPERYETNASKLPRRKSKPSKARHKSRQKNSQGPGQLVQNYKARNVSGDRLTLRPPELGLFNKGRTSMAARGRGLPDLVFSEMKFLQKHDDSKPRPQSDVPKKKRKKDDTHTRDGEISSFFASGYHTLREEVENKHSYRSSACETKRRHCDQTSLTLTDMPTVELGDREPCRDLESRKSRNESTSHISWSESVRARSTTSAGVQAGVGTCRDGGRHEHSKSGIKEKDSLFEQFGTPPVTKQTTISTTGCLQVSSLAPSYSRVSRSQSYPQYSSSPRRLNPTGHSGKPPDTKKSCSPSSMPHSVPQIMNIDPNPGLSASRSKNAESQTSPDLGSAAHPVSQYQRLNDGYKSSEEDLETSSDLRRILQACKETLHDQHWAESSRRRDTYRPESVFPTKPERLRHRSNSNTSTRRIPTVRFAELPCQYQAQPTLASPGFYEHQEQCQCPSWEIFGSGGFDHYPWALEDKYTHDASALHYDEDDGNGWNDVLEESILRGPGDRAELCMSGSAFAMDNAIADPRPGNNVAAPGFWRPNKLY